MPHFLRRYFLFVCLFLGTSLLIDCQSKSTDSQDIQQQRHEEKHSKRHRDRAVQGRNQEQRAQSGRIPQKVYDVLTYVRANNRAMSGYVGGRRFGNFENHLPRSGTDGKPIQYQEWDVNPKIQGRNRGTERLVTGSDGRAWFTNDHYNTFSEVK